MILRTPPRVLAASIALSLIATAAIAADEAASYFRQNCMSCHTIGGGRITGPDLKDVAQRKDRQWLARFIENPKQFLDGGDPYAAKLKEEARGVMMPPIPGITIDRANSLLDLIAAESLLEKSQFAGLSIGDQPFTHADIVAGLNIFLGTKRLQNGGPACISCHTIIDVGGLGGGQLGPDLTKVYERLQGRKALASWLQSPATAMMRPVYLDKALSNDEIVSLVAFLENSAEKPVGPSETPEVGFFLLGMVGAVFGIVGADVVWRKRFRGARGPLVRGEK